MDEVEREKQFEKEPKEGDFIVIDYFYPDLNNEEPIFRTLAYVIYSNENALCFRPIVESNQKGNSRYITTAGPQLIDYSDFYTTKSSVGGVVILFPQLEKINTFMRISIPNEQELFEIVYSLFMNYIDIETSYNRVRNWFFRFVFNNINLRSIELFLTIFDEAFIDYVNYNDPTYFPDDL